MCLKVRLFVILLCFALFCFLLCFYFALFWSVMSCLFMLSFNSKTSPELLNHVMRTLLENITGIRHSCCFFLKGYELWTVVTLNINESVSTTHIYIIRICCCLVFIHVRTVSENKNKTYKSWRILFLFYDHVPQNIQELTYPFSLFMIMCFWRPLEYSLWHLC